METTRSYISKGDAPLFFETSDLPVGLTCARAHDRISRNFGAVLRDFVNSAGAKEMLVAPVGAGGNVAEMVRLAEDTKQSYYRALFVEQNNKILACIGFGAISGCDGAYDCFGVVALDEASMAAAFDGLVAWMKKADARLLRIEMDDSTSSTIGLLCERGFSIEGRVPHFYGENRDQLIMIWRTKPID